MRGLTQAAAKELAPHGITVNAYCPGVAWTPGWEKLDDEFAKSNGAHKGRCSRSSRTSRPWAAR
ncbi:SDR family oxidoreductase [Pseudonocardia lutea]|uniref:SDR family oxidoreductase n=1 Tax=Pseudonocardia lutea TaxID=2172015 RepID=A0ABW1I581_9PSEU